ncbi:lasso peptide biosynthesis PqqD family chaperone, partial [Priestia megaterium]
MIKSEQILPKHVVTQSEGNIVSDMGNEKVMLNIENGKYYNLGEIGGDIWESISKP